MAACAGFVRCAGPRRMDSEPQARGLVDSRVARRPCPGNASSRCRRLTEQMPTMPPSRRSWCDAARATPSRSRPSTAGTRIYRLAANCCVDFLRSRQHRDRQATDELDDAVTPARSAPGLRVEQLDLERAIERLP